MQDQDKDEYSMEARIKNIGYNLLTIKDIRCNYTISKEAATACKGQEFRKNIVLITKEAINNIAKYSMASEASISLSANKSHITLSIQDNGNGFNTSNLQPGNGLKNIKARAAGLGGTALIQSEIGIGTTITCILPVTSISDTTTQ
jgi:signal transduction histidine kinase